MTVAEENFSELELREFLLKKSGVPCSDWWQGCLDRNDWTDKGRAWEQEGPGVLYHQYWSLRQRPQHDLDPPDDGGRWRLDRRMKEYEGMYDMSIRDVAG